MRKRPLNSAQREASVAQLKQHHLFSSLSEEQISKLSQTLAIADMADGDVLFTTTESLREIYILQSGRMKLSRVSNDGNEKIVELLSPGDSFAEAALFSDSSTYPVDAMAIAQSHVWCIDAGQYMQILLNSPTACISVMREMSRRLHHLVNEIDLLTLENATTRLIAYFLDQVPLGHIGSFELTLDYSKLVLASRLSIKPETLSRILSRLRQEELVVTSERTITLPDVGKLRGWIHDSH